MKEAGAEDLELQKLEIEDKNGKWLDGINEKYEILKIQFREKLEGFFLPE